MIECYRLMGKFEEATRVKNGFLTQFPHIKEDEVSVIVELNKAIARKEKDEEESYQKIIQEIKNSSKTGESFSDSE